MRLIVSARSRRPRLRLRHALLVLLVVAVVAASGWPTHQAELESSPVAESAIASAIASLQLANKSSQPATGQFRFHADSIVAFRNRARSSRFQSNEELLRQVIDGINRQITLPHDIAISFSNCYVPESSYDDEHHHVTI